MSSNEHVNPFDTSRTAETANDIDAAPQTQSAADTAAINSNNNNAPIMDDIVTDKSAPALVSPTQPPATNIITNINPLDQQINALIEQVFAITVTRSPPPPAHRPLVYMEEIAPLVTQPLLNIAVLDQALFERILLNNPADYLIPSDTPPAQAQPVIERRVLTYLHGAFVRNARRAHQQDACAGDACGRIEELIVRNAATAIKQPDLYEGQVYSAQLVEMLRDPDVDAEMTGRFFAAMVKELMAEADEQEVRNFRKVFGQVFAEMRRVTKAASLGTLEAWIVPALMLFVSDKTNATLALLLMEFNTPVAAVAASAMPAGAAARASPNGAAYADTLFGDLLRLSILPKQQNGRAEYFQNVMNVGEAAHNEQLWSVLRHHLDAIHTLFRSLLVLGGAVRDALLAWIGACLHANAPRGQLWNAHDQMAGSMSALTTASDSFMLGLAGVMLRLCKPLLRPQFRVLNVDPSYCAVPAARRAACSVHMIDMDKETCLVPAPAAAAATTTEGSDAAAAALRPTVDSYNFVTECFFMTHRALDISYRVCVEQFFKLNRELRRMQQAYQSAVAQGGQSETSASIMSMLSEQMPLMMCLQNVLLEPTADQLLVQFHEASAIWLAQLAARDVQRHAERGLAPVTREPLELPLAASPVPAQLASIPEFIVENIVGYLTFIRHFDAQAIDADPEAQQSLFTMMLVFMGDAERVRNPHVRARMAEGLESLLPRQFSSSFRSDWRTLLFTQHPHRLHCVESVLRVFVGIEMTGQSVQFEQKFNYRRPMYIIMEYLWSIPEQQHCFEELAERAEREMENVDPPIFLRFVNLLINDAIFLLDESLSNLQQIRTLQNAQDAGEWATLGQQERQQNVANMQHLGTMARFDNILGRDTIKILRLLTSRIGGIFCHAAMRERVAAMLNYFLLHLVGPNKGNFKVKDRKEFEFDPAHTVREISQIYINLQGSDEFALAVSQDGRSYSARLFEYAEQVLVRIGGGLLIGELNEFAQKVRVLEQRERVNQEALADAPDEFLDPIMSTLMLDPVRLPSSNVTVDRTTIARHLLSDQSDPFNRSPLTMDQVRANVELRTTIEAWMVEKRKAAAEAAAAKASEVTVDDAVMEDGVAGQESE